MRAVRRLLAICGTSLVLYAALFGFVLDRPLAYGFLRAQIDAKLARGAADGSPKLVILAGSNAPYSHRCELIERIVRVPCVNGGVAVGIGLDYLFARWEPLLHPGDIVYLPMEEAQYVRSRAATTVGPDAAMMFRHDWRTLFSLPPDRWAGALFSFDLRFTVMALIERALVASSFHDPRAAAEGETNAWGDHVGHTLALAAPSQPILARIVLGHPSAAEIKRGDGAGQIARFLRWARVHGVQAIGGWPTEFADTPMPDATRVAILYDLCRQRRRLPRACEPQPLSPPRLLRFARPSERVVADRAFPRGRGGARRTRMHRTWRSLSIAGAGRGG